MTESDWITKRFEENRKHLRDVAYRILGSHGDADDALQEAWSSQHTYDVQHDSGA